MAPPIASKIMKAPSGTGETEIPVPGHTRPIQFQALHLKLRGGIFEIVARTRILLAVEKPMHRINVHANINRMRFETLCFRGGDESKPLSSSGMGANPLLGPTQIAGESNGITIREL